MKTARRSIFSSIVRKEKKRKHEKPEFCHKVKPWLADRIFVVYKTNTRATMEFSGLPRTVRIDVVVIYFFRRKTLRSPRRLMKFFYVIAHFSFRFVSFLFFFSFFRPRAKIYSICTYYNLSRARFYRL